MDLKRKGIVAATLLGLISGPAIALAAVNAFDGTEAAAVTVAAEAEIATTTTTLAEVAVDDAADDLRTACVLEAPGLIEMQAAGTITDVEAAALEALRPICEDAGMPLPEGSTPLVQEVVIVETVTVAASVAPTPVDSPPPPNGGGEDDDHEDDDHEDDDHEDDDHEDDDDEGEDH